MSSLGGRRAGGDPTPRDVGRAGHGTACARSRGPVRRLQRHRAIWDELQHHLILEDHPNAIAVLFRVLLELSIENYINQVGVLIGQNDKLAMRVTKVAEDLYTKNKINAKYLGEVKKFQHADRLISADTMNRYVHSPDFAPSTNHLTALWDALSPLIVHGLNA